MFRKIVKDIEMSNSSRRASVLDNKGQCLLVSLKLFSESFPRVFGLIVETLLNRYRWTCTRIYNGHKLLSRLIVGVMFMLYTCVCFK